MERDSTWRTFQIMGGRRQVDFCSYIREFTEIHQNTELHIGCDSQNYPNHTVYVTTIVFRFPGNGAHVIYRKEKVQKIHDLWTKLWGETERSVEIANAVRTECNCIIKQIDLDYNNDPDFASNKLVSASTGYITSLGFTPRVKPNLLMAAWAANVLCH